MKAITIRQIDDQTYARLKAESKHLKVSMNKLLIQFIKRALGIGKPIVHHDFDEFFGSWSESDYNAITRALAEHRKIDKDLWK